MLISSRSTLSAIAKSGASSVDCGKLTMTAHLCDAPSLVNTVSFYQQQHPPHGVRQEKQRYVLQQSSQTQQELL